MLAEVPGVTAHFARFRVTRIGLDDGALGQFEHAPMLAAAETLADARADAICWNGTSAGWLGFDTDRALCAAVAKRTGVPAASAVLAMNAALDAIGARRVAFVTPYLGEVQERILARYAEAGHDCVAERHLEDPGNFSFALHAEETVARLVRETAAAKPDAILIYCTNFMGARVAPALEAELGLPVIDSVAAALAGAMRAAGADPARVRGWGSVFERLAPSAVRQGETA
jgi:maleate isomerase